MLVMQVITNYYDGDDWCWWLQIIMLVMLVTTNYYAGDVVTDAGDVGD